MIYSYDKAAQIPLVDIYDTQMMLALVSAAKDIYEKGLEEMKEFNKEYTDFTSPIVSHMQWINDNAIRPIKDAIDEMYANGIDPLRSKEGRALLSRLRNNIDLGKMAMIKSSAETAKQYQKAAIELKQKNLFNPEYEKWRLGDKDFSNWSIDDGMWTESSPLPFRDINAIVEPWVENLEPSFDEELTNAKHDGYLWSTVSPDRIKSVINDILPEFTKTNEGGYYRHLAEQAAQAAGLDPDDVLKEWLYNRASDHVKIDKKEDPYYKMIEQGKIDARIASIRHSDGGNGSSGAPSVFREADYNLDKVDESERGYFIELRGTNVGYDIFEDPHYLWMDPVGNGVRSVKDKDNGSYVFFVPSNALNTVYIASNAYGSDKLTIADAGMSVNTDRYFIPVGQLHKERKNGEDHYFITGTLTTSATRKKDENGNYEDYTFVQRNDGRGVALFDMEVTERGYNYAKKQAGVNSPSN